MRGILSFKYDEDNRDGFAKALVRGPGSKFVGEWLNRLADGGFLDGEGREPHLPGGQRHCQNISWLENVFYEAFGVRETMGDDRGERVQMTHCRVSKLIKTQRLMSMENVKAERWDLPRLGYAISVCLLVPALMRAQVIRFADDIPDDIEVDLSPTKSCLAGDSHTSALLGVVAQRQQDLLDKTVIALKWLRYMESILVRCHGLEAPFHRQTLKGKTEESFSWKSPLLSITQGKGHDDAQQLQVDT